MFVFIDMYLLGFIPCLGLKKTSAAILQGNMILMKITAVASKDRSMKPMLKGNYRP